MITIQKAIHNIISLMRKEFDEELSKTVIGSGSDENSKDKISRFELEGAALGLHLRHIV